MAAIVLAGGRSSRMGGVDKALLELGGQTLMERVVERLKPQCPSIAINANGDAARFEVFGLPVISDAVSGFAGPLAGVHAGLSWAANLGADRLLTLATDTPFFPDDLALKLDVVGNDEIAVAASDSRAHPTFALWPIALADELEAFLSSGERKVTGFIERHPHRFVEFDAVRLPGGTVDPFFNINTPDDLAEARRLVNSSGE